MKIYDFNTELLLTNVPKLKILTAKDEVLLEAKFISQLLGGSGYVD